MYCESDIQRVSNKGRVETRFGSKYQPDHIENAGCTSTAEKAIPQEASMLYVQNTGLYEPRDLVPHKEGGADMQATGITLETPAPSPLYPATTTRRSKTKRIRQSRAVYIHTACSFWLISTESQSMETFIPYLAVGPSFPVTCLLTESDSVSTLISSQVRYNPGRRPIHSPLGHLVAKYMHPTRHIAVKSTSDTLCASASMYVNLGLYQASTMYALCPVTPYIVHIC